LEHLTQAHAFAKHFAQVFQPHPLENTPEGLIQLLETPYQLEPPIKHLKRTEVQEVSELFPYPKILPTKQTFRQDGK
jgi:hypothetical protein